LAFRARRGCVGLFAENESRSGQPSITASIADPGTNSRKPGHEAEGINAMNIDKPVEISATKASGGVKLRSMRYVLGVSIALAAVAGMILWNIYATH
jgi:hypothetical protein